MIYPRGVYSKYITAIFYRQQIKEKFIESIEHHDSQMKMKL